MDFIVNNIENTTIPPGIARPEVEKVILKTSDILDTILLPDSSTIYTHRAFVSTVKLLGYACGYIECDKISDFNALINQKFKKLYGILDPILQQPRPLEHSKHQRKLIYCLFDTLGFIVRYAPYQAF